MHCYTLRSFQKCVLFFYMCCWSGDILSEHVNHTQYVCMYCGGCSLFENSSFSSVPSLPTLSLSLSIPLACFFFHVFIVICANKTPIPLQYKILCGKRHRAARDSSTSKNQVQNTINLLLLAAEAETQSLVVRCQRVFVWKIVHIATNRYEIRICTWH